MASMPDLMKRLSPALLPIGVLVVVLAFSNQFLDPTQPLRFEVLALLCLGLNGWMFFQTKLKLDTKLSMGFFGSQVLFLILGFIGVFGVADPYSGVFEMLKLLLLFNFILTAYFYLKQYGDLNFEKLGYAFAGIQLATLLGLGYACLNTEVISQKLMGGLFVNPNLTSQVLFLTLPLILHTLIQSRNLVLRIALVTLTVTNLLALYLLGSWTVFLALAVFMMASLGLYFFSSSQFSKGLKYALAGFGLVGLAALLFTLQSYLVERPSFSHRKVLWERTLGMIQEKPLLGEGISSWRVHNQYHVRPNELELHQAVGNDFYLGGTTFYLRPHNDFLWIWSEMGFLGLLLYLAGFGLALYAGIYLIFNGDSKSRTLILISTSALLSYLVIAALSFPKERIGLSVILSIYSVILLVHYDRLKLQQSGSISLHRGIAGILALMAGYGIFIGSERLKADYHMRNALEAKESKQWQKGLSELRQGESDLYRIASNGIPVSWYQGTFQMELGQVQKAHEYFLKAYQFHPTQIHVLNNLGTSYGVQGEIDSAIVFYRKATQFDPVFEEPRINLSGIYFNQGDLDRAWFEIAQVSPYSSHPQYRLFVLTILRAKWEETLVKQAIEKGIEEKAQKKLTLDYELLLLFKKHLDTGRDFDVLFFEELQ
ncbi:O-antigen ligase family protein [bacterium SCSIO 12741]|nr:O-antigen ligase family protein [bacterium SCSIO 12741]